MPSLDDYHAFKSTSGGNSGGKNSGGNGGCLGTFVWFFVILSFVMIAGKFL